MHHKVKEFIELNRLLINGDTLILGVSGGIDSMVLLDYFYTYQEAYQITIKVAHIHHGLRETADLDAELVEKYCKERKIPYFRHNCQIEELARQKKISEEEAGREERYHFFKSIARLEDKIVTAHHMNDQAETIMMRLIRGTGIKGLAGILPKNGQVIRPFLCLTRSEIETYCKKNQIPYREDETNEETSYTRNKIRLQLMPYLKENLNPAVIETIARLGTLAKEADDFIEEQTLQYYKACLKKADAEHISLDRKQLASYPLYMQKSVVFQAVQQLTNRKDYTKIHIESCVAQIKKHGSKTIDLSHGITFKKEYDTITFTKKQEDLMYQNLNKESIYQNLKIGQNDVTALALKIELIEIPLYQETKSRYTKCIDYEKVKHSLCLRTRTPEDYISLQKGHKKLSRVMIDDKIPKDQRDNVLLVADGNEIIWMIGYRFNTRYDVNKDTKKLLQIKLNKIENLP